MASDEEKTYGMLDLKQSIFPIREKSMLNFNQSVFYSFITGKTLILHQSVRYLLSEAPMLDFQPTSRKFEACLIFDLSIFPI
jgi:hypothetical protein